MAAFTVAGTLTLILLAVEKHLRIPTPGYWQAPQSVEARGASTESRGILLTVNPGLAQTAAFPPADQAPLTRRAHATHAQPTAGLLRRPPEPAANVVLQAPIVAFDNDTLPLHASSSNIDYLMEAMDHAFDSPIRTASSRQAATESLSSPMFGDRLTALSAPASIAGRIPEPTSLLQELETLQRIVDPRRAGYVAIQAGPYAAKMSPSLPVAVHEARTIEQWLTQTRSLLHDLIVHHGLEHPASRDELAHLALLAGDALEIGNALADHELAACVNRAGYALQRRVALWSAIQGCLDGTTIGLLGPNSPELARQDLVEAITAIEQHLENTGDADDWRSYLMLDDLKQWLASDENIWKAGNSLAFKVLSRLHWERLSPAQQRFLAQPEFEELAAQLRIWGREPVDYRQLLANLEQFETKPTSRANAAVADIVQALRHADQPNQQLVAQVLNDHYRNANIRLAISSELIQRLVPTGEQQVRPVRQRILGAETSGDSAIQTQLKVNLVPDPSSWNIDLEVLGDMVSLTRSSKGPAVFHNTSTAEINSHRYIRIDPLGYHISSEPTDVNSQDYLRKMSTDFDGLPVIGDFVRLIVREQFEQKRSLAQRITRRIIAQEADAEFDRRLEEGLATAEKELSSRIVGPLHQLQLNPLVVALNTTADRLTVRYRVANESQMAAYTPRPRAPSDSLLSLQLHQSTINNTIDRIGLCGRTWTLPELYARLGEVFQQNDWTLPEDVPRDITIRFDDHHPATVELQDGRLRLSLRIAELHQPDRLHIERFIVTSNYIPVADGMRAELVRDGVVEIVSNRDRLRLRLIFASIFVANPQIPLVAESWAEDPRAAGLAVSQVEIRDGWLAVAISNASSEHAAQVAERGRQVKLQ